MPDDVVSLFSDTGTQPTAAMRAAMAAAEVGDEQEGQDPTVNRLQESVAGLLGKEAALWFPSGTMCNLVAVKLHTRPGDVVIAEGQAHVVRAESGGAALASGVLVEPIRTERGIFTAAELEAAFDRVHTVPPPWGAPAGLICVEQTHNLGGGSVWPLGALDAVAACAREHGVPVHMDGARLLNACTASGVSAAAFRRRRRLASSARACVMAMAGTNIRLFASRACASSGRNSAGCRGAFARGARTAAIR